MAEDTQGREEASGGEQARDAVQEAPERVKESLSSVERMRDAAFSGDGMPKKVLVGAAIAGATAAAGYAAKRAAPKLKESLKESAADKAEEAAQAAASEAEARGGITGFAAKLLKSRADGGDGGGVTGAVTGAVKGVASKLTGGGEPSKGWGKGRRNPVQRWADVGVPVRVAYDQWTQFEEFPKFMHRVLSVQPADEDRRKVRWQTKIWFSRREWEAEITEQIPDKRIAWRTVSGTSHVGNVTFHELDDELTRVLVNLDFNPTGIFEKLASGLRFVKRATESDLCRFKAFIETRGEPTGAWRGRIENAEVVEDAEVETVKPVEEGAELHTPRRDDKNGDQEDGEQPRGEGEAEAKGGDEEEGDENERLSEEEREARRAERARRREERQTATA